LLSNDVDWLTIYYLSVIFILIRTNEILEINLLPSL